MEVVEDNKRKEERERESKRERDLNDESLEVDLNHKRISEEIRKLALERKAWTALTYENRENRNERGGEGRKRSQEEEQEEEG